MGKSLKGLGYVAVEGPYKGQKITVIGRDPLFPDFDRWLVRSESGAQWGVAGSTLRRLVDKKGAEVQLRR